MSLAHQRDKRGMCQVCANQGNITKEVKVEVISRKGSVTSFSRYIRSLYMYLTQTCTVIHVGTCTLSLIIMEQDSVKVRGHNKLLPLPERVVSLSLFLFIPLFSVAWSLSQGVSVFLLGLFMFGLCSCMSSKIAVHLHCCNYFSCYFRLFSTSLWLIKQWLWSWFKWRRFLLHCE